MTTVNDDNVGDFTNDLASDIGPLLALFGEKMTIQYLSESTTFLDYFIFAMAPIGIITGITSAIRLCGHASIRAFIGRSQEGEGAVEAELCTSTSRDVCELFTKGGVQRVLGRPSILELVYVDHSSDASPAKNDYPNNKFGLFLSRNYFQDRVVLENQEWKRVTGATTTQSHNKTTKGAAFAPNPNLSLNVGVRNQPPWVFWTIAATGLVLQTGVAVFAGVGVWILGWNLNEAGGSAKNYAPSMYITGTVLLCFGMWCCAALIGQTTDEIRFERIDHRHSAHRSRLLWLQPGPQIIGDQSFDPFAYFEDTEKDPLRVWNSSSKRFPDVFELYTVFAVLVTLAGYVMQFIGLRGMKGWVSLAQLGITVIMSLLRGLLRIKRLGRHDNKLRDMPDLVAGHELDWLASNIAPSKPEDKLIWHITGRHGNACESDELSAHSPSASMSNGAISMSLKDRQKKSALHKVGKELQSQSYSLGCHLFDVRVRLAHLTGNISFRKLDDAEYQVWEDEYVTVRVKARQVATAICTAAGSLNKEQRDKNVVLSIEASSLTHGDHVSVQDTQTIRITLKPPQAFSTGGWRLDSAQLEAALGLWMWGMISDERLLDHDVGSRSKAGRVKAARIMSAGSADADWDAEVNIQSEMDLWLGRSAINFGEAVLVCNDTRSCGIATLFGSCKADSVSEFTILGLQEEIRMQEDIRRFCGWSHIHGGHNGESDSSSGKNTTSGKTATKKLRIQYSDLALADASLLDLCAQELFTALMLSLVGFLPLNETQLSEESGRVRLENDSVNEFVSAFQEAGLGTSSDAMLCVVPALRQKLVPLDSERLMSALQKSADGYRQEFEWERAETTLQWACKHFAVPQKQLKTQGASQYFTQALMAAAELYRWSLARSVWNEVGPSAVSRRIFGIDGIKSMVATYGSESAECQAVLERYQNVVQRFEDTESENSTSESRSNDLMAALFERDRAAVLYGLCFMTPKMINANDYALGSVLPLAIRNDWSEVVQALFEMKANVNSVCVDKRIFPDSETTETELSGDKQLEEKQPEDKQSEDVRSEDVWWSEDEHLKEQIRLKRLDDERHPDDGRTALSYVAELGYDSYFKSLFDLGAAVDEPAGRQSQTPLSYAAKNGHISTMRLLLASGYVNVGKKDSAGKACLSLAAEHGHATAVQELLLRAADVDTTDDLGWTPLMFASFNGHKAVVEQLLSNGANPNIKNGESNSAHLLAMERGHEDVVEVLLGHGADVDSIGKGDLTALSIAAASGDLSMIRLLLNKGADVESLCYPKDDFVCRPLYYAIEHRHYDVVQLLAERGANTSYVQTVNLNPYSQFGCTITPIFKAVLNGDERMVELLIDMGADMDYNARDLEPGGTPLIVAIEEGKDEIARLLIGRGASTALPHRHWIETALERAVRVRRTSLLEPLLEKIVDIESRQSALNAAAATGQIGIVRMLVGKRGQLDLNRPLYEALESREFECARVLLELGAQLEARNERGRTMLHRMTLGSNIGVLEWKKARIRFLIEQGAVVDTVDNDGDSAAPLVESILNMDCAQD